jgi:RNA polymerase sigma-70 factor (ECF subfamily)
MVQQVFFKLWERNATIAVKGSLAAYLYRAVHNESLNHIKHIKVREKHQMHVVHSSREPFEAGHRGAQVREMESRIRQALTELPEQCRTIFQMSRFEELRYREIAERLQISVKTVEHQMGKALRIMREKLADFLVLVLFIYKILK